MRTQKSEGELGVKRSAAIFGVFLLEEEFETGGVGGGGGINDTTLRFRVPECVLHAGTALLVLAGLGLN